MKLNKTLSLLLLSALFSVSTYSQANTAKADSKPVQSTEQTEQNLKQFNENFGVTLTGRSIATTKENTKIIVLKYELTNKSTNKDIKSVTWLSGYTFDGKVIATQDMPINFNPALKAKEKTTIAINIPLENIPAHAQEMFLSPEAVIGLVIGAKKLEFTKGKEIIIE